MLARCISKNLISKKKENSDNLPSNEMKIKYFYKIPNTEFHLRFNGFFQWHLIGSRTTSGSQVVLTYSCAWPAQGT